MMFICGWVWAGEVGVIGGARDGLVICGEEARSAVARSKSSKSGVSTSIERLVLLVAER